MKKLSRTEFLGLAKEERLSLVKKGFCLDYALDDPSAEVRAALVPHKVLNKRLQNDPSGLVQLALLMEGDYVPKEDRSGYKSSDDEWTV